MIELINSGADVNIKNNTQETALMFAAGMGKTNHTDILISAGAEVNNGYESPQNGALMSAVMGGHVECLKQLTVAGADINIRR